MYQLKFDSTNMKIFKDVNLDMELVLKEVGIPFRALSNDKFMLTADQYKALAHVVDAYMDPDQILSFSVVDDMATFIPEFFAGLCAENGLACVHRIAKYKKIVAPVEMTVVEDKDQVEISYRYKDGDHMPRMFVLNAQIIILSIIRKGTGLKTLKPIKVESEHVYSEGIDDYLGLPSQIGKDNVLVFSKKDMERPFVTKNNHMWAYLEDGLNQRLAEMEVDTSFSTTVRRALTELIPSGVSDVDKISYELGVSKRTLQRKLKEEGTTFNQQLNHTRELLVRNYLKVDMTLDEIAYMVNYSDAKSLSRAFKVWTGKSVSDYRKAI